MMTSEDSADRRHTDTLKTVLALHAIAIDGMAEGLCVLDGEFRVVLFNRRLLELFDLAPETVKLGASLKTIFENVDGRASASSVYRAEAWRELENIFAQQRSFELNRRTANGTLVRCCFQPVAGDGWVVTCALAREHHVEHEQDTGVNRWHQIFANSSRGVCVYDANKRLIFHNDRYLQVYGFNSNQIRPGMSYRDILDLAIELGIYSDVTLGQL